MEERDASWTWAKTGEEVVRRTVRVSHEPSCPLAPYTWAGFGGPGGAGDEEGDGTGVGRLARSSSASRRRDAAFS